MHIRTSVGMHMGNKRLFVFMSMLMHIFVYICANVCHIYIYAHGYVYMNMLVDLFSISARLA